MSAAEPTGAEIRAQARRILREEGEEALKGFALVEIAAGIADLNWALAQINDRIETVGHAVLDLVDVTRGKP